MRIRSWTRTVLVSSLALASSACSSGLIGDAEGDDAPAGDVSAPAVQRNPGGGGGSTSSGSGGATSSGATSGSSGSGASMSPPPVPPPASGLSLAVAGNRLVDAGGKTVRLLGVDRSGQEFKCIQGGSPGALGWGMYI